MARLSEGFDMETGRDLGREKIGATKILQYLGPREKNNFAQLHADNPKLEGTQFQQAENPDSYLDMDYELHLGTKIDYLSKVQDFFKRLKYSYYKTSVNKNVPRSSLT